MIERNIKITVDTTPEELAHEFCNMNDEAQARFFNSVANITEKWDRPFCFQLQYISDQPSLTKEGRYIMEAIGDYGRET